MMVLFGNFEISPYSDKQKKESIGSACRILNTFRPEYVWLSY